MKEYRNPVRCAGAAAALVLATAIPAFAIRPIAVVSRAAIASVWDYDASDPELTKLPGKTPGEIGYGMDRVFDGSFADTNAVYMSAGKNGAAIVLEFPALPEIDHAEHTGVYVSEIVVGHVTGCDCSYSLYWSDTETNKTTTAIQWNPVPGAQNVTTPGITNYAVKARAMYLKYVFDTTTGDDSLTEIQVKGYVSDMVHLVSSYAKTTWYNADGSAMASNGGGGTGNPGNVFNGRFGDYQMFPRCGNGGYFVLDLSGDFPNGCYFENVVVDTTGEKRYSVLYTEDGSTWKTLVFEQKEAGKTTYNAGYTAKQIKYVFVDGSMWDYSTQYFAEFQVWGMNADDIPCTHPDIETVPWTPVAGSATCTAKGTDERFCPGCGERFTKISDNPPLGHDYVSTLTIPGGFKRFGTGSIACSRCDYRIDFVNTPETASTNGPVDLVPLGGLAMDNLVQFTDVTVTSTDHTEWGPNPAKIIDNTWTEWWVSYWVSAGNDDQHADFHFGTEIDLTKIEISVKDVNQTFRFYAVDEATGEETQLVQFGVVRTDLDAGHPYHVYRPEGTGGPKDYGDPKKDFWDELVVEDDPGVPPNQKDENGNDILNNKGETIVNCFQTFTIRFFEQPCGHLRIRCPQSDYSLWSGRSMCLIECHPWGIVRGAGETRYRKETMIIFR